MSRPRQASLEAKLKLAELEKKVNELQQFKDRVELGQRWLLCLIYAIGGFAAFVATVLSIIKDWPKGIN